MIFGKISENEKRIKIEYQIYCTNCSKQVPGGLKVGENYSKTKSFEIELEYFKKSYLCGVCRDKKRKN